MKNRVISFVCTMVQCCSWMKATDDLNLGVTDHTHDKIKWLLAHRAFMLAQSMLRLRLGFVTEPMAGILKNEV